MPYQYNNQRQYDNHPYWFEPETQCIRAASLFQAIHSLENGHFPELVSQMTERFAAQFEDVPCDKKGNKKLGSITYHKCGLAVNSEGCQIIVPPLDTEINTSEKDDISARLKIISDAMGRYHKVSHRHREQELRYFMTGKAPSIRNGLVGKSLQKITKLVEAVENAKEADPIVFSEIYGKIFAEIDGTLDISAHERNYPAYTYGHYNDKSFRTRYDHYVRGIEYYETETVKDAAEQLAKGTLDFKRAQTIIDTISKDDTRKTIYFPSLIAVLDSNTWEKYEIVTDAYKNKIKRFLKSNGIELKPDMPRTIKTRTYTYDCRMNTEIAAENYAYDLLGGKIKALHTVFDAVQAYRMYDAVKDGCAREFFLKAGFLIKDWEPDTDLCHRVADIIPVASYCKKILEGNYRDELLLTNEIHEGAVDIAKEHAALAFGEFRKKMNTEKIKERTDALLG